MARLLSDEWITAFNDALAARDLAEPDPTGDPEGAAASQRSLTVLQIVQGGPEAEIRTLLRLEGGRLSATKLPHPDHGPLAPGAADRAPDATSADTEPDVAIRLAWDDALCLVEGRLPVAEALAQGRIRVRGSLSVLAGAVAALAEAQPLLSGLRDSTTA